MSDMLNKTIVLVLNRNWQAINIRTPRMLSARWPQTSPPRLTSKATEKQRAQQDCICLWEPDINGREPRWITTNLN
jgi:hypothetical protein